jgi:glycerol-3-phosphate dehydrogenase
MGRSASRELPVNREASLGALLAHSEPWDIAVIGGGATGVGIAVDAASRGYSVSLLEQNDFGKGTSSRSTKLVHGGVRYLRQGNISFVMEALKERGILRQNAPHLVHDLAFIVPSYSWWEAPYYGIGLKTYDMLAGRHNFGRSRLLTRAKVLQRVPTLETEGLRGGVLYHDGQFDDTRLLINLVQTAAEQGAVILNYSPVTRLSHDAQGRVDGLIWQDLEAAGAEHALRARAVINAAGVFADLVRRIDDPDAPLMIAPSQGAHVVLDRSFLPGDTAFIVPRTRDARVMFAIPWHEHALLGTTDVPIPEVTLEPVPMDQEIDFILETASYYFARPPKREDIRSAFAGIRPLARAGDRSSTARLSRDHIIHISKSGLLTISGGKWTTYRKMAEDCVNRAANLAGLAPRPCVTGALKIHGYDRHPEQFGELHWYGTDAAAIRALMQLDARLSRRLHESFPLYAAQVVWAVRHELARTVEDVLARRTRALFLDAAAALAMAADVASLVAGELGRDVAWQEEQVRQFRGVAQGFMARRLDQKE